ncbi:MAG: right-handed parallel beta-helix repeat-containing protein [Sedimentisphaerales bacterium]|nr:right-handed parallel beta-helix repeat-containing protein [Sedimentisphaerales bacterium]
MSLLGGFAGAGASDPNSRDIVSYETVLSGDLAGDDVAVADPCDLLTEPTRKENSYAIVTAGICSRSAVLDGFTIRAGYAERLDLSGGAGLSLYSSSRDAPCCPSIRNCTFMGNAAHTAGAIRVTSARPELVNCSFLQNAGIVGGAIWCQPSRIGTPKVCEFVIRGCTFADNYARDTGGAIHIDYTNPPTIEDSLFTRNSAKVGGAIYVRTLETVNMANCRLIGNKASEAGAAVCFDGTELSMTSCTISGNLAPVGGALARLELVQESLQAVLVSIVNTILWSGDNQIHVGEGIHMNVMHSDICGGWPGKDNLNADPLFANPGYWDPNGTLDDPNDDFWVDGDYHLKSQGGRWDPVSRSWVKDDVASPCIDAGDPNSPVGEEPFPNGGRVNMGAYGGTAEASKSYFGEPVCETIIAGDINGDCIVDLKDLALLTEHWLAASD